MMLASVALVCLALDSPSPAALVSRMLERYHGAQTLSGTIRFTQAAGPATLVIETVVQYEWPSQLAIIQRKTGKEPQTWRLISDGELFTYEIPPDLIAGQAPAAGGRPRRLFEKVVQNGVVHTVRDIYGIGARGLGDRSVPLDIAIGRRGDLQAVIEQWTDLRMLPDPTGKGEFRVIGGGWRAYGRAPVSGEFELWLDEDLDLRRYVLRERVQPRSGAPTYLVVSTWDVDLKIGGPIDPALFKIQR